MQQNRAVFAAVGHCTFEFCSSWAVSGWAKLAQLTIPFSKYAPLPCEEAWAACKDALASCALKKLSFQVGSCHEMELGGKHFAS